MQNILGVDEVFAFYLPSMLELPICCVDAFSRKAWAIPMKDKTAESIIEAFETVLNDSKDNYPKMIMSDQDSD